VNSIKIRNSDETLINLNNLNYKTFLIQSYNGICNKKTFRRTFTQSLSVVTLEMKACHTSCKCEKMHFLDCSYLKWSVRKSSLMDHK